MNTLLVRNFRSFFVESRFISLVVSIAVIALRFLMFLKKGLPDFQISSTGFVWPYIEPVFQKYPLVSFLSSTLSVFIISYLISELNVRYGVIRMRTSMPFYVPLILFSVHPFFLRMTPDFPALIFILWSLFPLLASYQYHHSHRCAYQFSALIAFVFYVFGDNISGFIVPFQRLAEIYDFTQPSSLSVPQWGFIGLILLFLFFIIVADGKQITRERSFTKKVLVFSISVILVSFLLQTLYLNQTFIWLYVIISFFSIIAAHFYTNTTFRPEILSYFLVLILLAFYYCLNLFTDLSPF